MFMKFCTACVQRVGIIPATKLNMFLAIVVKTVTATYFVRNLNMTGHLTWNKMLRNLNLWRISHVTCFFNRYVVLPLLLNFDSRKHHFRFRWLFRLIRLFGFNMFNFQAICFCHHAWQERQRAHPEPSQTWSRLVKLAYDFICSRLILDIKMPLVDLWESYVPVCHFSPGPFSIT